MKKPAFYARLALQNLGKNRQFCLPYLLTAGCCAMMFYLMLYLCTSEMVAGMPGASEVLLCLALGSIVIAITDFCILWYANRFIMRRRQKELGLYYILGMEKRQVAAVLGLEALYLAAGGILLGLAAGVLFSKLVLLALVRLVRVPVSMGFSVSGWSMAMTALLQGAFALVLLAANWVTLARSRPVELLHAGEVGEREPKSRRLLALAGALLLGGGYAIALRIRDPAAAMLLFFVAVVLVIFGTHCLFGAGSVVVLKALRKNRRFYYRPRSFTAVSGLLYRMKQNARGLANICILATMVLVTVSTTVCMYAGAEDMLQRSYPEPITLRVPLAETDAMTFPVEQVEGAVREVAVAHGCGPQQVMGHLRLAVAVGEAADGYDFGVDATLTQNVTTLDFVPLEDYNRLSGQSLTLAPDEVAVCGLPEGSDALRVGESHFRVVQRLDSFPVVCDTAVSLSRCVYLVVSDRQVLAQLYRQQAQVYGEHASSLVCAVNLRPTCGDEEMLSLYADACLAANTAFQQLAEEGALAGSGGTYTLWNFCRQEHASEYYALYGGFLFLGLFLGLLFLLATVLIIYYKQLSEGYEDRQRFVILQQVGMSAAEVRATIRAQVLLVFFLPLATAAVHVGMAFPMLSRMLRIFNLDNVGLFAVCTGVTLLVFGMVYVAVYALTARKYYRIVRA